MSSVNFPEALNTLQQINEDTSKLLKILINIRKDVEWPKHKDNIVKLRHHKGCLKKIIESLQTSRKPIIDVALSILGNCCLDHKCARDVMIQWGILPQLNQLLKRYPKEDSINGRIFRIVGNLCQHEDYWSKVIIEKKPQIIIHNVKFMTDVATTDDNDKTSEATVIMAIRSLRELVSKDNLKELIQTYGVLKAVGLLLIKYGSKWRIDKSGENVLLNIVKLLQEYARYRFYPAITEMRNTEKGDAIVYLSRILLIAPRQIIKIVMNFLRVSQLKSDLPIPEIFDSFIEVLRNDHIIKDFNSTCIDCIKCICHLLEHPGNRKNERCGDSIPILVNVLKNLTLESHSKIECCILIISTLRKCRYNESLLLDQIKCDILPILTEKLKLLVGGALLPLAMAHNRKRKNYGENLNSSSKKIRVSHRDHGAEALLKDHVSCVDDFMNISSDSTNSDEESKFFSKQWNLSPATSSNNSESELAMSWTSGLSPRSQSYGFSESDSDDYSPVCSEVDPTEFPLAVINDDDDKYSDVNLAIDDDVVIMPVLENDSSIMRHAKNKLIEEIVNLLRHFVKLKPTIQQLANAELLFAVIKCFVYFDWSCPTAPAAEIVELIRKILDIHDYLLPLMMTEFIPAVYDLGIEKHSTRCPKCCQSEWISRVIMNRFTKVAESGAGKGDIAHKLLRGDPGIKQQLVLVIPYVIRNKSILVKLMLNCGGLDILMKLLQDEDGAVKERSIKVLCVLASKKLHIPNPMEVRSIYNNKLPDLAGGSVGNIVTFKLDDDTLIRADRDLLSKNSDFFHSLLNGAFKESQQDVISLHNVGHKSFKCLLHLIKCHTDEMTAYEWDLATHLDVIALCDRFLLGDLCVYLTGCVEKSRLTANTIPKIYQWSMESHTNLLRVECIAFALVANVLVEERLGMFRRLFSLGYNEELVDDIRKLLLRYFNVDRDCDF